MKQVKEYLLILGLLCGLYSCDLPDIDSDKIEIDEIPTAFPVGYFTYSNLNGLIPPGEFEFTVQPLVVSTGNGLPAPQAKTVPVPTQETEIALSLDSDPSFVVEDAILEGGQITFGFKFNVPSTVTLEIEVPGIVDANGEVFRQSVVLPKNQNYLINPFSVSINLAGYRIRPEDGKLTVITGGSIAVDAGDRTTEVRVEPEMILSGLQFASIKGFFGQKQFSIGPVALEITDQLSDAVKIGTGPAIMKLKIENSFGVPFELDLSQVTAVREDNSTFQLTYSGNRTILSGIISGNTAQTAKTVLELNSSNSNVARLLDPDVKEIVFRLNALANPGPATTGTNLITNESAIKVTVGVQVPLKITPGA